MNTQALISLHNIRKNILAKSPSNLLFFALFGSQVRGTERPDSDLDFLYVVKDFEKEDEITQSKVSEIVRANGGLQTLTRLRSDKKGIYNEMNIYGTVNYRVMRGEDTMILYKHPEFDLPLINKIDFKKSAEFYFHSALVSIALSKEPATNFYPPGTICSRMYNIINDLLKTCLLYGKIKFPFTKDLHVLYEMLPLNHKPKLNMDVIQGWDDYIYERYRKKDSWTKKEASQARRISTYFLNYVRENYPVSKQNFDLKKFKKENNLL